MHSRLSSLLLIGLLFTSALFFYPIAYSTAQNPIFGFKIYLRDEASDIPGYRNVSLIRPLNRTVNSLSYNVGVGSQLIGKWISRPLPFGRNVSRDFLFLFSMYANSSLNGNATLYAELHLYRNNSESLIFTSSQSARLNYTAEPYFWQSRTTQDLNLLSGDRIVFKLYLNVLVAGNFTFYYDCLRFPSYFEDPTETRYFTSDIYSLGINSTTSPRWLNITNSASSASNGRSLGRRFGIRVWNMSSSNITTEITSGTPVATVIHLGTVDDDGEYDGTWSCPSVALQSTDRIYITVYSSKLTPISWGGGIQSFVTTPLGASSLDAATWTIHYWLYISGFSVSFWYGSGTYPSQITNFQWTPAVTKAWNNISTWTFQLNTRQWATVGTWTYQIIARQWNTVGTWLFQLDVKGWRTIAVWYFTFESSPEIMIVPILFLSIIIGTLIVMVERKKRKDDSG